MFPDTNAIGSGAVSAPPRRVRVLVVDDEPDTVMTLLALLLAFGLATTGWTGPKSIHFDSASGIESDDYCPRTRRQGIMPPPMPRPPFIMFPITT